MQLLTTIIASLVLLLLFGQDEGVSALLGGLVAFCPSALFAKRMFSYQGARAAKQILRSLYIAEALKIGLTSILFCLVFLLYKVVPFAFFFTYIVVVLTHRIAPLIFTNEQNRLESN